MSRKLMFICAPVAAVLLVLAAQDAFAHGISEAARQRMLEGGLLQYLWLGAEHMLTGYDHLLFIFGVVFFLAGARDILKYITAFTLGHSVTLIFATFYGITANYFLVDAVIALSVCYKGFDNVDGFRRYLNVKAPTLVYVIFAFGLVHGFGLSTRLQQLPLGESGLLLRILSFNVGVEVGQVIALLVMVALLSGWRKAASFEAFSKVSNYGLIAVGFLLLIMQLHGYSHTTNPDEFGFSSDNHYHEHEKMIAEERAAAAPTHHETID